jgi:hypothetical protein
VLRRRDGLPDEVVCQNPSFCPRKKVLKATCNFGAALDLVRQPLVVFFSKNDYDKDVFNGDVRIDCEI